MKLNRLLISLAATFAVTVNSSAHDNAAAHSDVAVSLMEMLNVRGGDAAAKRTALEAAIARNLLRAEAPPLPSAELDAPAWFGKPSAQPGAHRPTAAPPWAWSARRAPRSHQLLASAALSPMSFGASGLTFGVLAAILPPAGNGSLMAASFAPFKPKVRYYWDSTYFYEESDGIPDRTRMPNLMVGITSWQQQVPLPTSYFASTTNGTNDTASLGYLQPNYWRLPLVPVAAASPISLTGNFLRGAVALGADGVAIFNPRNNTGQFSQAIGELDAYGGHCGLGDDYHYHIFPTHLTSVLGNDKPIAWGLDGYPVYGYVEPDGSAMQALDSDGGHNHGTWGYHYHARGTYNSGTATWTPASPYMMSAMHGTVVNYGGQIDPQPTGSGLRGSGTGGYTAQPVSGASIVAFKNPVALSVDGSGHFIENIGGTASNDDWLMRISISGVSYDICWRLNRNANPKTMTITWRLPAATTTTTYSNAGNRITAYPMAANTMAKLPDTSQTLDTTATFGEDADYTINAQSFADNGNSTITDNITGLMWQKVDNGESTWDNAVTNAAGVTTGGFTDWRLPTPSELFSIFNHNNGNPALNTTYFPNNPVGTAGYWWTSDIYGSSTTNVWCANSGGGLGGKPKAETLSAGGTLRYHARYVRGGKQNNGHNYTNNNDGTITDNDTGLMWQQVPGSAVAWDAALSYAENLSLGGYGDWRLPNVKELQTLTDYALATATTTTGIKPSINRTLFPAATATAYWSSTTVKGATTTEAWLVEFGINAAPTPPRNSQGIVSYEAKTSAYPVFAVRAAGVARSISQGIATTTTANLLPAGQRVSGVGTSTATDGTTWTVPSATQFATATKAPDLYNEVTGVTPANIAAVNLAAVPTVVVDADGEVITGYIFADNYFELYVNGTLVGVDPVPYTPFNSCVVKFKAKRPITYAVKLVDWEEHLGVGSELNGADSYHAGDGGFMASFSDGTVTNNQWKAQSFYIAPLNDPALVIEQANGTHDSSAAGLTAPTLNQNSYALHYAVPSNWFSKTFDATGWPAATTYTEATVGVTNKPAYTNFPAQFSSSGASFIWSSNLVLDNEVIVRYTGPTAVQQIAVEQPSGTALTDGTSTVAYGNVSVGSTLSKTFVFRNNGSTLLTITGTTIDGTNAANFTVTTAPAGSVAAGGSTTMDVQFNAASSGAKVAAIHIASSDTTVGAAFDITLSGTGSVPPPTITAITNQTTMRNNATSTLAFTVGDPQTAAASLTLSATSSNTTLVPVANIVFGGSGASRTVTVTPASGQTGTATIIVTVSNGSTTTSTSFTLTVSPPNILFIIADDYGLDASTLYNTSSGVSLPPTPNIVSLAATGVQFNNAYTYTVCSPTRSAILTGRYGFRTGTANVVGGAASNNSLKASEFTLPKAFAANISLGYQLKHFGKWHLGGGNTAPGAIGGWPSFAGSLAGEVADYYSWPKVATDGTAGGTTTSTSTTYATTDVVNDAVSFISTQTTAAKPWVAWVAFNAPHTTSNTPLYHLPVKSLRPSSTYDLLPNTPADIAANPLNYYNAMIEAMDTEIGRLLLSVDLTKTDVIFIGDNGTPPATLQAPYPTNRGKASLYEGGIRVPLIIRGFDVVAPGRTSDVLTHFVDLYSTILELAGINVASTVPTGTTLDSQSLLPVLKNQAVTRSLVFGDYYDLGFPTLSGSGRVLRNLQYKLIRFQTGTDQFYDLLADPYEGTNLLAGGVAAMTTARQTAYNSLVTQLANYNTAPTIGTIANQSIAQSTATSALALTVGDAELSPTILAVSGSSSNTTLVPTANVVIGGSGATRTVTVTPASGLTGTSTITLSTTDGVFTTTSSFVLTVSASVGPPTITAITASPAAPTNTDTVAVTANVQPSAGRTLSSVQLTYSTGAATTATVFTETMAAAAANPWTGTNAINPWTVTNTGGGAGNVKQTLAANHGTGNPYGLDLSKGAATAASTMVSTTNNINATGTAGYVEFWIFTQDLASPNGWTFQLSPDGGTTWNTRASELTGSIHAFQLYHYDLIAAERVSTLKMRFQFAGNATATPPPRVDIDDITVVTTTGSAPVTVTMFDDGAHGDGAAGDGVYGVQIPAQTSGTTVSYTITATDSNASSTTSSSASYTVATAAPVLAVTPATTLSSAGAAGSGSFTPASIAYTLTNTGTGTMSWTAGKTASWLTLSSASGTLVAGANTTVTASINTANANSLSAATYNDTITFTNSTNGSGNATRAVSLLVTNGTPTAPSAPVIATLPTYSSGTSKTLTWPAVSGATSYTLQIASSSNFATNLLASQTVTSPTGGFTNLANGFTYYYRVLATNSIGSSVYSNVTSSTQDTLAPSVAITSPATGTSTATNTTTVTGTSADALSGISSVTVNGVTATSANSFATWTATAVPLGFGTNALIATATDGAGNITNSTAVTVTLSAAQTYNPLIIPEALTGTTFNLTLAQKTKQFRTGNATNTLAYNDMLFWGPTLIMNKGDTVQINVINTLIDTTTVHWHGFHIPAIMDGGPHQTVPGGTIWSPSFTVKNDAATYWYHPHLHGTTQEQLTKGAGGMIIVRDPAEAALALPRTYGVDDIPLAITSRRFLTGNILAYDHALDNYGDYILVNGTLTPQVTLPKQYVRLRILNAEIARGYNLGFSDNRTFYVIANEQGLVNTPVAVTRVKLMVGERVEILVNLGGDTLASAIDLKAYNSGQLFGFPGQEGNPSTPNGNSGPINGSLINNTDFNLLHIVVGATTANPITALPATLAANTYWIAANATNTRTITLSGGAGGSEFTFNNVTYTPTLFNHTVNLNTVEQWTISNQAGAIFGHSFHIHDVKFNIIARAGGTEVSSTGLAAIYESGWKDTLYVPKGETVTFLAKFDDFASTTNPFMFHCHFLQHEDGGMMGQFRVVNNAVEDLAVASFTRTGTSNLISLLFKATVGTTYNLQYSPDMTTSSWSTIGSVTSDGTAATFTETDATRLGQARGFYRVTIPTIP